jgi:hypothetical protein
MKLIKYSLLTLALLIATLPMNGCADLSVDNLNDPTREAVLGDAENTLKLLAGGFRTFYITSINTPAIAINLLSDQITTTNLVSQWWDFAEEPRLPLDNTTAYSAAFQFSYFFGNYNSAIATANIFIDSIENDGDTIMDGTTNVTDQVLSQAYFLRGIARGYIGMMYDQGYLLEADFDDTTPPEQVDFFPYQEIIAASLSDLDRSIELAESAGTFTFSAMPNASDSWTRGEFLDIVNSYAARIGAGEARTAQEAEGLNWGRILNYANAGIGGPDSASGMMDFTASNVGSSGEFANYLSDFSNFLVAGGLATGAGYLPVDVKLIHMLDPEYPTVYPAENVEGSTLTYPPAESDDPRLDYFNYTTNIGFINAQRNAGLATNYWSARLFAFNDWWPSSYGVYLFTSVENDMLRAEAQLMSGATGIQVAETLNNSTAGSGTISLSINLPSVQLDYFPVNGLSGGHTYTGLESVPEFQWALLREYSVELEQMGGVGIQWFFMRRHDLLQTGTATMYPVPASELELLGRSIYTFGGVGNAGSVGTASGANSWTNLAEAAFGITSGKRVAKTQGNVEGNRLVNNSTGISLRGVKSGAGNQ